MTQTQKKLPKVFLRKHSKSELEKEISHCSKCEYGKSKSGCHPWGDKPCSQHGRKLTQLEDEVKENIGKEVVGIIENSQIRIVLRPTFNEILGNILKTPPPKKIKKNGK